MTVRDEHRGARRHPEKGIRRRVSAILTMLLLASFSACNSDSPPEPMVSYGEAVSADGVTIRYEVRGAGEPTLVLVHGWTNSRGIWGRHPETLAESHRVVALDLGGHGISGTDRSDWTVEAFGRDIVAVADQLELDRIVLVGFSMGGPVIIQAAEQLGDRVDGLVFVDTVQDPEPPATDPTALEQMLAGMQATWNDPVFIRAFGFTPDTPDSLIDYAISVQPEELYERFIMMVYGLEEWVNTEMVATLGRLDVPMAAINTTEPPTDIEAMRRYDPGFTLDTMQGVGHAGILLRRVEDFDARLLAIVDRFAADRAADVSAR